VAKPVVVRLQGFQHDLEQETANINEIKRTANLNNGVPLGVGRFFQETGIKVTDWRGKIWIRWSDAVRDAGLKPNQLNQAYLEGDLVEQFIAFMRELGHFPVAAEIKLKRRQDKSFPSRNVFGRFGSKQKFASRILAYCNSHSGYEDIAALCTPIIGQSEDTSEANGAVYSLEGSTSILTVDGYVYMALLKLGREKRYKIGKAVLVGRRTDQISLQLPEKLELYQPA
jgi:hypothetical protein